MNADNQFDVTNLKLKLSTVEIPLTNLWWESSIIMIACDVRKIKFLPKVLLEKGKLTPKIDCAYYMEIDNFTNPYIAYSPFLLGTLAFTDKRVF